MPIASPPMQGPTPDLTPDQIQQIMQAWQAEKTQPAPMSLAQTIVGAPRRAFRGAVGLDPNGTAIQDLRNLGAPDPVARWVGAYADVLGDPSLLAGMAGRGAAKVLGSPVAQQFLADTSTARFGGGTPEMQQAIVKAAQQAGKLNTVTNIGTDMSGLPVGRAPISMQPEAFDRITEGIANAAQQSQQQGQTLFGGASPSPGYNGVDIGLTQAAGPTTLRHETEHALVGLSQQNPQIASMVSPTNRAISAMQQAPTKTGQALGIMGDEIARHAGDAAQLAQQGGAGPVGQALAGAKGGWKFLTDPDLVEAYSKLQYPAITTNWAGQPHIAGAGDLAAAIQGNYLIPAAAGVGAGAALGAGARALGMNVNPVVPMPDY